MIILYGAMVVEHHWKKIALGDIEQLQLKEQGLTVDSIPAKDQLVQLRANSNISTGGDSIDMTDEMHASYKEIAVGISKQWGRQCVAWIWLFLIWKNRQNRAYVSLGVWLRQNF